MEKKTRVEWILGIVENIYCENIFDVFWGEKEIDRMNFERLFKKFSRTMQFCYLQDLIIALMILKYNF